MPKVDRVKADLKFAKAVKFDGKGEAITWKTLGLGAEATVLPNETYETAQEELYHQVASELRLLFGEQIEDRDAKAQAVVGDEAIEEPPTPPDDPSWCAVHKAKMKMRSWGGYSHKVGEQWCQGHWCSEHGQPFKKFEKEGGTWWSHSYEDSDTGETLWCREDGEEEEIQSQ